MRRFAGTISDPVSVGLLILTLPMGNRTHRKIIKEKYLAELRRIETRTLSLDAKWPFLAKEEYDSGCTETMRY